jgi:Phage tail protein
MSNSTEEYWDVDGTSLNQYCYAIKTFGGSRLAVPKLRGDNALLPGRHGRIFKPKTPDSKVITLAMWVAGIDPSTNNPGINQDVQFNDNWKALTDLFWSPGQQLSLTKRWFINAASPTLIEATAKAELAGTMDPTMTGRTRADFGVDLLLADPFFYSPVITTAAIDVGETLVINNPGDVETWVDMEIEFNGELINPTLWNMSTNPIIWMTPNTLIQSGYSVDVNVGKFEAIRTYDNVEISPAIDHSGYRAWFKLNKGNNSVKLTSGGIGTGNAIIKYRAAFL